MKILRIHISVDWFSIIYRRINAEWSPFHLNDYEATKQWWE